MPNSQRELRHRRILPAFILAHFTHHLCTGILIPLSPLLRNAFNLSYSRAGLLISAYSLSYGLSQLPMGGLADRVNKKLLISLGLMAVSLTTFSIGLSRGYYQMLVLLILMGLFGGTYHPAASPLLSHYFPKERRGRVLGFHLVGGASGFLVTPVVAGLIAQAVGWQPAFIYLSLPAMLASVLFWQLIKKTVPHEEPALLIEEGVPLRLADSFRALGFILAFSMVIQLVSSGVHSFLPLFLVDKHGVFPAHAAMLVGMVVGSGIVASPLAGAISDRVGRVPVILVSAIAGGPLILLLTLVPFGWPLILNFILLGMAISARMPAMESLILETVPAQKRSTVLGIYYFLGLEMGGIAAFVVGLLLDRLGLNSVFSILGLIAIASSALLPLMRRRVSS